MTAQDKITNASQRIAAKLAAVRRSFAAHVLIKGLLRAGTLLFAAAFLIILVEGFRYLDSDVRRQILFFYLGFGFIFLITPLLLATLILRNRMQGFRDLRLAKMIEAKFTQVGDSLLNALQLRDMVVRGESGFSVALVARTLDDVAAKIEPLSFKTMIPIEEIKKSLRLFGAIVLTSLVLCTVFPGYFGAAAIRMTHPAGKYAVPQPFSIYSETGSVRILGGDSTTIALACQGRLPDRINLRLDFGDYARDEILNLDSLGRTTFRLEGLRNDVIYEGYAENRSPFVPWKRISSGSDTIRIINRPEILQMKAALDFPDYTGLPDQLVESNSTEFYALPGTRARLQIAINKPVSRGYVQFRASRLALDITNSLAQARFAIMDEDVFRIYVEDEKGIGNLHPVEYSIRINPDAYPVIVLTSPREDLDLDESMEIPLGLRISDDYGFSRAAIRYKLVKKYSSEAPEEHEEELLLPDYKLTLQEIYHLWNIADLGLMPEDVVQFRVEIYDNDVIKGPKRTDSRWITARFPSLNDLFTRLNGDQEEISEEGEEVLAQLEQSKEILAEIARELLKDQNLQWEQKTQLEQELKKTREAAEKLQKIGERLEQMIQSAQVNQLFDEETLQKYTQLQEAFQDILTPELRAAMEKLQKALETMDPKKMQEALDSFKTSRDEFAQELDRMLELFKRIKIEQTVNELARRFDDLANRQDNLSEELDRTEAQDFDKLSEMAKDEKSIKRDMEIAADIMEQTSRDMHEFPLMPSREFDALKADLEQMGLPDQLQQAGSELQQGNQPKASKSAASAAKDIQQMAQMMKAFQSQFNQEAMQEVAADFERVIRKTIQLSKQQETINQEIRNTPYQSEQLMDVAVEQQNNYRNLAKVIDELISLSNKTFGVTPRIGRDFGRASVQMTESIRKMEERNVSAAASEGQKAGAALNSAALELMNSMQSLMQGGSGSGYESYLKQLQNMAGMQKGINGETMMLPSGPGGQAAMQRLAARQQQVRRSLEQLQQEMSGSNKQTGDLGGIAKDMEEVIKDLQNNRVLRQTIERQQHILSRLLDAQKSLRTQDYKEERISRSGSDIGRTSPGELPANLGERRTLLQQNLEKALKDGYRHEYEELIRKYFEALSKPE